MSGNGERSAWEAQVDATLAELLRAVSAAEARLSTVEAQLEALDASSVRSQGQREHDLDRADRMIEKVRQELDHHLGDHWRQR